AHAVGAQEPDVVEERACEQEVDAAGGAIGRDHAHPRGRDETEGGIREPVARRTEAPDLLQRIWLDAQDRTRVARPGANEEMAGLAGVLRGWGVVGSERAHVLHPRLSVLLQGAQA